MSGVFYDTVANTAAVLSLNKLQDTQFQREEPVDVKVGFVFTLLGVV